MWAALGADCGCWHEKLRPSGSEAEGGRGQGARESKEGYSKLSNRSSRVRLAIERSCLRWVFHKG